MKKNNDVRAMLHIANVNWEEEHKVVQKEKRRRETAVHKVKDLVGDLASIKLEKKGDIVSYMKEDLEKGTLPEKKRMIIRSDGIVWAKYEFIKEAIEKEAMENYDSKTVLLLKNATKAYKRKLATPVATRPHPDVPKPPDDYPYLPLSLEYEFIRGRLHGTLGAKVDAAMGVPHSRDIGEPNKYLHAIEQASKNMTIQQRMSSQRQKRHARIQKCHTDGCTKKVWQSSRSGHYCYEHSAESDKLCVNCGKKGWRYAGRLCAGCSEAKGRSSTGEHKSLCTECGARESVKRGSMCSWCAGGAKV
jgi:hypothetical protein